MALGREAWLRLAIGQIDWQWGGQGPASRRFTVGNTPPVQTAINASQAMVAGAKLACSGTWTEEKYLGADGLGKCSA
jgi:hypothetical protein